MINFYAQLLFYCKHLHVYPVLTNISLIFLWFFFDFSYFMIEGLTRLLSTANLTRPVYKMTRSHQLSPDIVISKCDMYTAHIKLKWMRVVYMFLSTKHMCESDRGINWDKKISYLSIIAIVNLYTMYSYSLTSIYLKVIPLTHLYNMHICVWLKSWLCVQSKQVLAQSDVHVYWGPEKQLC